MNSVRLQGRASAWAAFCVGFGLLLSGAAGAAEKQISRSIGKEMQAAQKALQANQWNDALKNLDAAASKPGINAFDRTKINEFKGFAYIRLNNNKAALQAYEQALQGGEYTPEEIAKTDKIIFTLAASIQDYPKALEYGKKLVDGGGANTDTFAVMGQTYYLQKDCKNAAVWIDRAITSSKKAGEAPKEAFYQIKLRCAFDANDNAATQAALNDLIRLTDKTEYWNQLIRFMLQDERDDRNILMLYRVMYNTNSMSASNYYVEMAQLLLDAGLPGEAQAVLEKAFASGAVKDDQKERTTRILNAAKTRADADRKGLAQLDAEAQKSKSGEADVKLGEVYYGFGDYQNAVKALQRGLAKGQVKRPDEANVYLGLAESALKNTTDAKKAFAALKGSSNLSPRVLSLWDLYADKKA